jgi:hypothetical protein
MANTPCPKLDETLPTHPNHIVLKKFGFYILLAVFHLAVFLQVKDFPFLGDSIPSNLTAAHNIYNNHFATVWNTPDADPGHPTLYPMLVALVWAVLGNSLWVTHLVQVVLGFLLVLVVHKIARNYYSQTTARFAALLFAISPLYVAQLTNASLHLPLTLAAFTAFYFWQQKKYTAYTIALCAMMLVHLQGAFLLLFLCLHDVVMFYINNGYKKYGQWLFKRWWVYSIPFLVFITWGLLHATKFGWAFTSPNYMRDSPTLKGIVYNFVIAFWRIADFGYIAPLAAVVLFFIKQRKKIYLGLPNVQAFIGYLLLLLVVGGGIAVVFAYPPIHRYFLASSVLLLVLFAGVLQTMPAKRKTIWAVLAGLALVAGNFMYYPGKCIGDGNIAYTPIFSLEKQIAADFAANTVFYTYAPLSYPSAIRYADATHAPHLKGLYNTPLDSVAYVLQSAMNCEFTSQELEVLQGWHGTSYSSGGMYINIYANPDSVPQKPKGWQLRQPTTAEKWLQHLKQKFQ